VNLLVDTHALLWFAAGDRRLSRAARRAMEADDAGLLVSAASVWEMAIKASLGRLRLPTSVDRYVEAKLAEGYRVLPVTGTHAAAVERLPWHHRDPFDRLRAPHAALERLPVVTRDGVFSKSGGTTVW
jgi:PIN domain nuclease of toxin-antitoxin system